MLTCIRDLLTQMGDTDGIHTSIQIEAAPNRRQPRLHRTAHAGSYDLHRETPLKNENGESKICDVTIRELWRDSTETDWDWMETAEEGENKGHV